MHRSVSDKMKGLVALRNILCGILGALYGYYMAIVVLEAGGRVSGIIGMTMAGSILIPVIVKEISNLIKGKMENIDFTENVIVRVSDGTVISPNENVILYEQMIWSFNLIEGRTHHGRIGQILVIPLKVVFLGAWFSVYLVIQVLSSFMYTIIERRIKLYCRCFIVFDYTEEKLISFAMTGSNDEVWINELKKLGLDVSQAEFRFFGPPSIKKVAQ